MSNLFASVKAIPTPEVFRAFFRRRDVLALIDAGLEQFQREDHAHD